MSGRLYTLFSLTALTALLIALPGCGGGGTTGSSTAAESQAGIPQPPKAADTVSTAQIDEYPAGQPTHTVLQWWRYIQLNDPKNALPLYASEPSLPDLAGQFNYVAEDLAGQVEVTSSKITGTSAKVEVEWTPPDGSPTKETLELEKLNGEWKLIEVLFVDEIVKEKQEEEAG